MGLTNDVVEALKNPETYDEKVTKVEMLQTHISFVFLTDRFVYKVKKPVDFGFLDYTTLEKRRFYCEEEIRINRLLCGDMYIGVVTINKDKEGRIKVNGEGETIEYAVKMKRQPEDAMMTRLLERGEVTSRHIDRIARLLSDFHKKAQTGPEVDEYGSLSQVRANWVQNFEQTRALRGRLLDTEEFDFVEGKVRGFMEKNHELFERRVKERRIRQCHGDVHSGNIFIPSTGRIYIFDAIEFFKGFSCSDVASEVAFLAMDLEFQGKKDLSDHFVKRYLEYSGDKGVSELLDFYLCYRAYVRAKVIGFKIFDPAVGEEEKKESERLTVKYFNLARKYASRL
ncbi:MAG: phosphotransferase [Candidatus Hydrothermarchaeales archaeon]